MTEEEFLEARDCMAEAVARAKLIVGYVSGRDETASVDLLEDGRAVLTSWRDTMDYDSSSMEEESQYFPGELLFCPEAEVAAWKEDSRKAAEAEQRASQRTRAAHQEAQERAAYEALKAKYG